MKWRGLICRLRSHAILPLSNRMIGFLLEKPSMGIMAIGRQDDAPRENDLNLIWLMINVIELNEQREKLRQLPMTTGTSANVDVIRQGMDGTNFHLLQEKTQR